MKFFRFFFITSVVILLTSCAAHKHVWYIQDAGNFTPEEILKKGQIRIKPLDQLTIVVNSKDPELALPFNASASYASLSGGMMTSVSGQNSLQIRTVDGDGMLDMPVIGKIKCDGKTKNELADAIAEKIKSEGYINDPSVNVQFANMKIAVIGEVTRPGYYDIARDKISIFDALAMAGDITVWGVRTEVAVAREENGIRSIRYLDLTSHEAFNDPSYYLQQNDIVYVKPNKQKARVGEANPNRGFYISILSTLISVTTLIVTITK